MRVTAHSGLGLGYSRFMLAAALAGYAFAQGTDAPWLSTIAKLASSLSEGNAVAALDAFDHQMKDYGAIEADVSALVAQNDVLCAIDVTEDKPSGAGGEARAVEVDWYEQLKSNADAGPTERRRVQVKLLMSMVGGKWRISAIAPRSILAPIQIK